jgi:hypothetical protein
MAILAKNENILQEEHRQHDFAVLYDMMIRILEEVRTNSSRMPPNLQQLDDSFTFLQVSLAQSLLRGCWTESNA